ncbi:MAG: pyridoxal phosphate-dependent aminotransferase family protein [Kiritimatiellae bacterium]|nr:pyridoxal phosphate-dependent aminotransferase family protein [Kiritimatiellia bacterium]
MSSSQTIAQHHGSRIVLEDGRAFDYYCGCDYLSLQTHPEVREAAAAAVRAFGMTGTVSGGIKHPVQASFEAALTRFTGKEAILSYPSNYMGMQILLSALARLSDAVFVDAETHYSSRDALRTVEAPVISFKHRDVADLGDKLQSLRPGQRPLLLTDGVFPVTGAIAPLDRYMELLAGYPGHILCVDDAHAVGILGVNGRGALEHFGLERLASCHATGTMSKALGGRGGFIGDEADFISRLRASSMIPRGATAASVPDMAAGARALQLLHEDPQIRRDSLRNTAHARDRLRELGFDIADTPVPIISLRLDATGDIRRLGAYLLEQGIMVRVFEPREYTSAPDVPSIRIAIFASHTADQIDRLIRTIRSYMAGNGH